MLLGDARVRHAADRLLAQTLHRGAGVVRLFDGRPPRGSPVLGSLQIKSQLTFLVLAVRETGDMDLADPSSRALLPTYVSILPEHTECET